MPRIREGKLYFGREERNEERTTEEKIRPESNKGYRFRRKEKQIIYVRIHKIKGKVRGGGSCGERARNSRNGTAIVQHNITPLCAIK